MNDNEHQEYATSKVDATKGNFMTDITGDLITKVVQEASSLSVPSIPVDELSQIRDQVNESLATENVRGILFMSISDSTDDDGKPGLICNGVVVGTSDLQRAMLKHLISTSISGLVAAEHSPDSETECRDCGGDHELDRKILREVTDNTEFMQAVDRVERPARDLMEDFMSKLFEEVFNVKNNTKGETH